MLCYVMLCYASKLFLNSFSTCSDQALKSETQLALFSLCCGRKRDSEDPVCADTPANEPGKRAVSTVDEMEGLLKAIEDLESSLDKAKNEGVRQHIQSACTAMRNAVEDHGSSATVADQLARLVRLPEAMVSCRPPPALPPKRSSDLERYSPDIHPFSETCGECGDRLQKNGGDLFTALQRDTAGGCATCKPPAGHSRCDRLAPPPSGFGCKRTSSGCCPGPHPRSGAGAAAGLPPGICVRSLVGSRGAWREKYLDTRGGAKPRSMPSQATAVISTLAGGASGARRDRGRELPSARTLPFLTPHGPTAQQRIGR